MKIYLDMVGCRLNQSELELIARQFTQAGHSLVGDPAEADLAVVNTCTVTSAAAADSRKVIRRIARSGVQQIISTGCWSELEPETALDLPGVSRVVPNAEKDALVSQVLSLAREVFEQEPIQRVAIPGSRSRTRAFIKAQDGCRHRCTFCVTTIARGGSRSEQAANVISEINAAQRAGFREVVLTGVQLGSWGHEFKPRLDLADLVQRVLDETEIPRLRLSSIEPWDVSPELIGLVNEERIARHLHLPLQSGSAATLRRMARAITPDRYAELVNRIRRTVPGIAITTDILVGFPGESEGQFLESLDFVREMSFAEGHIFSYSPRPGTQAADFPDQVDPRERKKRSAAVRKVVEAAGIDFRSGFLGSEQQVLWEQVDQQDGTASGLSDNYLRVTAPAGKELWNKFSRVKITGLRSNGVVGEILEEKG